MKILLVSATKFEISILLESMKKKPSGREVPAFGLGKHTVDVLIAGVGMTSTAFHLGRNLPGMYDLAINAGVAGSFKKTIQPGTVVNVVQDRFSDLGAEDGDKILTLEEMGLKITEPSIHRSSFPIPGLNRVKGITVNTVHGNATSIRKVVRKFNPDLESMEGAAFFFACNYFKIPCAQVRAISNYMEKRNKKNWKLDLAVKNLNIYLEQFLLTV